MKLTDKKIILAINTVVAGEVFVAIFDGEKSESFKRQGNSDQVLEMVAELLKKNKRRPEEIRAVLVVSGPGSFTAVRQGVVGANAFGYLLRVPVVGVKLEEFKNEDEFLEIGYKKLLKAKKGTVVLPAYGREPNITKPKKWKL